MTGIDIDVLKSLMEHYYGHCESRERLRNNIITIMIKLTMSKNNNIILNKSSFVLLH